MGRGCAREVDSTDTDTADEEGKYGEPVKFDPTFHGPIKNRSCTDVICCFLFACCIVGWITIGVLAFLQGDPQTLIYPTDSLGNVCGLQGGAYENKPVLFFFDLAACAKLGPGVVLGCPTPQVCLEKCPTTYFTYVDPLAERSDCICKYHIDPITDERTIEEMVKADDCAPYYVESSEFIDRCIPALAEEAVDVILEIDGSMATDKDGENVTYGLIYEGTKYMSEVLNLQEFSQKVFQDFVESWWIILISIFISMVISWLWILLMRCIAWLIIWLSLISLVGLLGFGCYYCFKTYSDLEGVPDSDLSFTEIAFTTNLSAYLALQDTWLAFGIIISVLLVILLLVLLFLRTRIMLAIELIGEASKAVGHMNSTLFFPLITFLLEAGVFVFGVATAVFLASSGKQQSMVVNAELNCCGDYKNGSFCNSTDFNEKYGDTGAKCMFIGYGGDFYNDNLFWFQLASLFMWLWMMYFVIALGQMTLAGAFASYYWAWNKPKDVPTFAVTESFWRSLRYHLGSLAFGSLLIAIMKLIRIFLEYIDYKLKASENMLAKFCMKCLKCCFWCLERFLKFLNKNAYIMIAIYGKNFCTSARTALFLIMRNVVRVFVLDNVTDFLLFIGKLMVVGALGLLSFFWFTNRILSGFDIFEPLKPRLKYNLVPVIVITIGAYLISSGFFSVYGMAVDTLFLCFVEDCERHDGSEEKPYYMSKSLMKICGKKNKKPKRKPK